MHIFLQLYSFFDSFILLVFFNCETSFLDKNLTSKSCPYPCVRWFSCIFFCIYILATDIEAASSFILFYFFRFHCFWFKVFAFDLQMNKKNCTLLCAVVLICGFFRVFYLLIFLRSSKLLDCIIDVVTILLWLLSSLENVNKFIVKYMNWWNEEHYVYDMEKWLTIILSLSAIVSNKTEKIK